MIDDAFSHLRNAPATEAVIDIRTQPRSDVESGVMRRLARENFTVEEIHGFESEIKVTAAGPQVRHQATLGYRFVGSDGRVVVQATVDGIATSRLQPYTDWNDLIATAKDFWAAYVQAARPQAAVRLGVRYINRLDLPVDPRNLGQFLVDPPRMFPGTSGALNGFLKRVVTAEDGGVAAIVTQAIRESSERRTVVILDVDCAITASFDPNDPMIWNRFTDLRLRKNRIFFGNITAEARMMYE